MISTETRKKISTLQLHVKKILNGFLGGEYRSRQKGYGLEFDQLRDYQLGDDIRFIDWKSTARMNKMLVKEYIHEHTKTILIALDLSGSGLFSSTEDLKKEITAQIATVLTLAADYSKAHIGLVLFSDSIELYIPPKSGILHINTLIKKIWTHVPKNKGTNIKVCCDFLARISKKDTLLFFISDFIDTGFQKDLGNVAQRYDMVALRCLDRYEIKLPALGFLNIEDSETGQHLLINLKKTSELQSFFENRIKIQNGYFKKYGIDFVDLSINQPFIDTLVNFFARRLIH
jgi:uncharacterized protein (DUF58 family)